MSVTDLSKCDDSVFLVWVRLVTVGLICLALSLGWNIWLYATLRSETWYQAAARVFSYEPEISDWVISGVLTPLSETLIMALVWVVLAKAFTRILGNARVGFAYVPIVVILSFVAHGGTPLAVGRAIAFALLGMLFLRAHSVGGVRRAWSETAAAHVVWNMAGLALLDIF